MDYNATIENLKTIRNDMDKIGFSGYVMTLDSAIEKLCLHETSSESIKKRFEFDKMLSMMERLDIAEQRIARLRGDVNSLGFTVENILRKEVDE